jgi:hypothetical protein
MKFVEHINEQKDEFFRLKFRELPQREWESAKIFPFIKPGNELWYRPSKALIYPEMIVWLDKAHKHFDGDIKTYKVKYELESSSEIGWRRWLSNIIYGIDYQELDF